MTITRTPVGWVGAAVLALALAGCGTGGTPLSGPHAGGASPTSSSDAKSPDNQPRGSESQPRTTAPTPGGEPVVGTAPTRIGGVEVLPATPGASSSGLPGLSHRHASQAPLLSTPLPRLATGQGRLVDGYPTRVLPQAPHSLVLVSSVSPSGHRLQVSLTARGRVRPMPLERFYRLRLARLGFRAESVPAVAGTTAVGFARGDSHVTLTIRPGRVTHYSLFATLSAD